MRRLRWCAIALVLFCLADLLHVAETTAARHWSWRLPLLSVWLFDGVPLEATYTPSAIRAVQHLSMTWGSGQTTSITIAAVTLSASVVHMAGNGWYLGQTDQHSTRAYLATTTTLQFDRGLTVPGAVVEVEVAEFVPSLLKHATVVNLGLTVPVANNESASVATGYTVDRAKSLGFFQGCTATDQQSGQSSVFNTVLDTTTTMKIRRGNNNNGSAFACMASLVEFK